MRPILTKDEAEELVARIPEISDDACDGGDQRTMATQYQSFIQTHRCEDLVQLIKSIYNKNQVMLRSGTKAGMTDKHYMKKAEMLLHVELAVALVIPMEQVANYIGEKISKAK